MAIPQYSLTLFDFGVLADGLTDDSAAIQGAIDNINEVGGGTLVIPPGTYVVNASLVGKSNVHIKMEPGAVLDFSSLDATHNAIGDGFITVDGSLGTAVSLSANATPDRTDQNVSATAHGLAVGDLVLIRSEETRLDETSAEVLKIGELSYVKNVPGPDTVILINALHDTYNTSDTAAIVKVTPVTNFHIEGGKILGPGAPASGSGDRGIWMSYVDDFSVSNVEFFDVDFICVSMFNCINGTVSDSKIQFDHDGAGRVQYGITYGSATQQLNIERNKIYSGRHAIVQSNTTNAAHYGIARNITISDNFCMGTVSNAISTHQGVEGLTITGNTCQSCLAGVDIRFGKDTLVANNRFIQCGEGIHALRHAESIVISDNYMTVDGDFGIRFDSLGTDSAEVFTGGITITGNVIYGISGNSAKGVYIFDTTSGRTADDIVVDGNVFVDMGDEAIRIFVGDSSEAADGWTGSVCNNYCRNLGLGGSVNAIYLSNPKNVLFNDNVILEGTGTIARGILIDGDGAIGCRAFNNLVVGTAIHVGVTGGTGHQTDSPSGSGLEAVVAATATTLPSTNAISVTGTTTITSVTASTVGRVVTLVFAGILTFTDGSNLVLAGDFVTTADDSITLMSDGTNWIEISRSVN